MLTFGVVSAALVSPQEGKTIKLHDNRSKISHQVSICLLVFCSVCSHSVSPVKGEIGLSGIIPLIITVHVYSDLRM